MESLNRQTNNDIPIWKGRQNNEEIFSALSATAPCLNFTQDGFAPLQSNVTRALGHLGTALCGVAHDQDKTSQRLVVAYGE